MVHDSVSFTQSALRVCAMAGGTLRLAVRSLSRRPVATLAIVAITGMTYTAVVGTLTIARSAIARPLPYKQPSELLVAWTDGATLANPLTNPIHAVSIAQALRWRNAPSVSNAALLEVWDASAAAECDLVLGDRTERLHGVVATTNTLDVLGIEPLLGRGFEPQDTAGDTALISFNLWRRTFGSDPQIVGRLVNVIAGGRDRAKRQVRIIGVLPDGVQLTYPEGTDIWMSTTWQQLQTSKAQEWLLYRIVIRRRAEYSQAGVTADLDRITKTFVAQLPSEDVRRHMTTRTATLHEEAFGGARGMVSVLGAIAMVVAVFAAVALAGLFLANSIARTGEFAIMSALGASRTQIFWLVSVEGILACIAGAGVGLMIVMASVASLDGLLPPDIPRASNLSVDAWVSLYTLAIALITSVASTLFPALSASRCGVASVLASPRVSRSSRMSEAAVLATQVAVVVVMATASSLLVNSLWRLTHVDPGFETSNIVVGDVWLTNPRYRSGESIEAFRQTLKRRITSLPGVTAATITSSIPFRGVAHIRQLTLEQSSTSSALAVEHRVDEDYFRVLNIPIVEGRGLRIEDGQSSEAVAVISRSLSQTLLNHGSTVGRLLKGNPAVRIVGIAADVRDSRLDEAPRPAIYLPIAQQRTPRMSLMISTTETRAVAALLPGMIHDLDPEQPLQDLSTMSAELARRRRERELYTYAAIGFVFLCVGVTAAAVYASTARAVRLRAKEIGIRIALGASRTSIIRAFGRIAGWPVMLGICAGLSLSFAAAGALRAYLFEVEPQDSTARVVASLVVGLSCSVAVWMAARRTLSVDAVSALRSQ